MVNMINRDALAIIVPLRGVSMRRRVTSLTQRKAALSTNSSADPNICERKSRVLHMTWEGGWDYTRNICNACGLGT